MGAISPAVESLRRLIDQSRAIVFFGGAGMSTESGIPDFRSLGGLYRQTEGVPYEEMLSIRYFLSHPDTFWTFYRQHMLHPEAKPNAGHLALARLSGNERLYASLDHLIGEVFRAAFRFYPDSVLREQGFHCEVIEALLDRDAERAKQMLRQDVQTPHYKPDGARADHNA